MDGWMGALYHLNVCLRSNGRDVWTKDKPEFNIDTIFSQNIVIIRKCLLSRSPEDCVSDVFSYQSI